MANGSDTGGVRKDGAGVTDERRARPAEARGPGRGRKAHPRTGAGLGGEGRNKNGVAQERQAKTSRNGVTLLDDHARRLRGTLSRDAPARRRHCIRMTLSRGKSEPRSALPAASLNNRPNRAAPAGCWARKYSPDPARSMSLRSTALPAPTPGASVSAAGIPVFGGDPVRGSGHLLRSKG